MMIPSLRLAISETATLSPSPRRCEDMLHVAAQVRIHGDASPRWPERNHPTTVVGVVDIYVFKGFCI